ncbi:MAG TPA: GNAT family N-acetyltransferase [Verrucomicrobiae bacterium]|nr:GNAT family N-acetyltransferase [Verrucomicrobiae bacterium]
MKSQPVIREISTAETQPLRKAVLRPNHDMKELHYPGDELPEAAHLGAFLDGELVGIATVHRESLPGETTEAWRVRGMAVASQWQRQGIGRVLLRACVDYIKQHGGTLVWFTARTSAVKFYKKFGFTTRGEEFEIPTVGPHYVMTRNVADG